MGGNTGSWGGAHDRSARKRGATGEVCNLPAVLGDSLALGVAKRYMREADAVADRLIAAGRKVPQGARRTRHLQKVLAATAAVRSPWVLLPPRWVQEDKHAPAEVQGLCLRKRGEHLVPLGLRWDGLWLLEADMPLTVSPHALQRVIQTARTTDPAPIAQMLLTIAAFAMEGSWRDNRGELQGLVLRDMQERVSIWLFSQEPAVDGERLRLRTVIAEEAAGGRYRWVLQQMKKHPDRRVILDERTQWPTRAPGVGRPASAGYPPLASCG